jgi:hypothetical protein
VWSPQGPAERATPARAGPQGPLEAQTGRERRARLAAFRAVAATAELLPTDDDLAERAARILAEHRDGEWTDDEIAHAERLLDAVDADGAHWQAGDYLLELEPMQPVSGAARNGAHGRLEQLAARVGRKPSFLRGLRATSHAWPPEARPDFAPWHVCRIFTRGGPEHALERLEQLRTVPVGPRGKVTVDTFTRWRNENLAPARYGPQRVSRVSVNPWLVFLLAVERERKRRAMPTPAAAELAQRVCGLADDIDLYVRDGGDKTLVAGAHAHLDALVGVVERIAQSGR